ncbi:MAG: hypothetical protein IJ206_09815 [Oscillospiraceae bacterium]|nr:hypothetical protein [Oscillospiraceae bacterium]
MGELKYKVQRLEETPGPRIVLIGGSSAAFSVDSAALEREFPEYSVVNFGMYAALGTTVMLDLAEPRIREGDIVILLPEQTEQTLSGYFDASVMWQGLDGAFSLIGDLPRDKRKALLSTFPAFAGQKLSYSISGSSPVPPGVYARSSFNEYGDVESPLCVRNEMPGGYDENTRIRFDADIISTDFIERINRFTEAAQENGAECWYILCPVNRSAVYGEATPEDFYQTLRQSIACPLIGNPNDSVMDPGWFFDTNFHLNSSGKLLYTRALADGIKAMLGDCSPSEIQIPGMPEPAEIELWEGNDRDADCFLYERNSDTWSIVGLTDQGRSRSALIIPSTCQSLPVRTIQKGALSGSMAKEIVIQQNIRSVIDGAFEGCDFLDRIVMEQETPSLCRVGQDLLLGTRAVVYVPEDSFPAYRSDYFWSIHGQDIQPER